MYEDFFGFHEAPFELTPNPRHLVITETHREALSNLHYAIAGQKGVTLLVGEAGVGKTTVIRAAVQKQSERTHCIHITNPALTRSEFVELLAMQFGLSDRARASKAAFLQELEQHLLELRAAQERTVLILDEAQRLSRELMEEVRLLANLETDEEKLLTLVIAGQPEVALRLNRRSMQQLKQRVTLRCTLRPLTVPETAAYISSRITSAGGAPGNVFTREAVGLITQYARGLPRTINVISDNALLGGFAAGKRPVTREIVRQVCLDFDINAVVDPFHSSPSFSREMVRPQRAVLASAQPAGLASTGRALTPPVAVAMDPPRATDQGGATFAQRAVNGLSARWRRLSSS
jgi:general secretion pathway protein A